MLLKLHLWTELQKQCSHIFYHFGHSGSRVKLLDTRYVHCIYAIHWMLLNIAIIYCHVSLMIHGSRKKLLPSGIMAYTFASYSTSLTTSATRTPPETTRIEESPGRRDQPSSWLNSGLDPTQRNATISLVYLNSLSQWPSYSGVKESFLKINFDSVFFSLSTFKLN